MIKKGYIALARGIMDHPLVGACKPFSNHEVWEWMIHEAAWKPKTIPYRVGRATRVINIERGQLSHSLRFMADQWGWTIKKVRIFLRNLEEAGMIGTENSAKNSELEGHRKGTQTTTQKGTQEGTQKGADQNVITICNYDLYQAGDDADEIVKGTDEGTQKGRATSEKGHKEEEITNNKRKNIRSRDEPDGFADWYAIYPKKKKPKDAAKAFAKVMRSGEMSLDSLLERTRALASHWASRPEEEIQFCPYPASWLNGGEYLDEPEAPRTGGANTSAAAVSTPRQDPKTFTIADWQGRIEMHRKGTWSSFWGPAPGEPGCLVPRELLIRGSGSNSISALATAVTA